MTIKLVILTTFLCLALVLSGAAATTNYDNLGRLTRVENSDGTGWSYTYDENGNQTSTSIIQSYDLTINVTPPNAGTVTGAGRFVHNQTSALSATAGSAFDFAAWKKADGTVLSTNANYNHSVTGNETLTAHFTPIPPPVISVHPTSGQLTSGSPISLAVTATGRAPLSYSWKRNGQLLPDTSSTLTRSNATFLDAGTYTAEVTNPGGTTTSQSALITIPISSYTAWQNGIFTPAEISFNNPLLVGQSAVIGNDGMNNLLHYAFGATNRNFAPSNPYRIVSYGNPSYPIFAYNRLIGCGGLTYKVATSTNLMNWDTTEANLEPVAPPTPNSDGITETVRVALKQPYRSATLKSFFRLDIAPIPTVSELLNDTFAGTSLDSSKWTASRHTITVNNNWVFIRADVMDQFGILATTQIPFNKTLPLVVTRRVKLHYSNQFSLPSMHLNIGTLPSVKIHYGNMIYNLPPHRQVIGIVASRNDKHPHSVGTESDCFSLGAVPWDQWFEEKVTYNPTTGIVEHFINNISRGSFFAGFMPFNTTSNLSLRFDAAGWYTGHEQTMDWINISQ